MAIARKTDPDTSHQAANSVTNLREKQRQVYCVLKEFGPLTDKELISIYNEAAAQHIVKPQATSGIRTRRSELVGQGLVRTAGKTKSPTSKRPRYRWEAL
jgi:uncharacterized protein (DUF2225 family)